MPEKKEERQEKQRHRDNTRNAYRRVLAEEAAQSRRGRETPSKPLKSNESAPAEINKRELLAPSLNHHTPRTFHQ